VNSSHLFHADPDENRRGSAAPHLVDTPTTTCDDPRIAAPFLDTLDLTPST
jgi:hypothetical protein